METRVTVHTQSQKNRNLHLCPGLALLLELESSKVPGHLLSDHGASKGVWCSRFRKPPDPSWPSYRCLRTLRKVVSFCLSTRIPGQAEVWSTWLSKLKKKKITGSQRWVKKNAALQIDSEGIELVTHRHLHGSFDWFSQRMLLFTLHTFEIDEPDGRIWDARLMPSDCSMTSQLHNVRWTFTIYRVHLDWGANRGEIPGIGESPQTSQSAG